jgi:2-polyprenyl-3-methyl-5-hydroxy-6-metoxy-1,4-benzoquinol methylase
MGGKKQTISQFDEWSETYEEGIWGYYFSFANKKVLNLLKRKVKNSGSILDVGCGPGLLIQKLGESFSGDIVGLDISPKMIELAKKKCKGLKNVSFENTEIENAKLKLQFDAIVCMNSFHHYENHADVLSNLSKLVKKDGVIILLDPHRDNPLRRLWTYMLRNWFDEKDVMYFTKKQIKKMADESGLRVMRQDSFLYFALISEFRKA